MSVDFFRNCLVWQPKFGRSEVRQEPKNGGRCVSIWLGIERLLRFVSAAQDNKIELCFVLCVSTKPIWVFSRSSSCVFCKLSLHLADPECG